MPEPKAIDIVRIFKEAIANYHVDDSIDAEARPHYPQGSLEELLYRKNWIDTVQWHLEDIIRSPHLPVERFIEMKRRIDKSNQIRTDLVEKLDDHFLNSFNQVQKVSGAVMNSETPAWLIDRISILCLKIWHMEEQTQRKDADQSHIDQCRLKLGILLEQENDLMLCYDQLIDDLFSGRKYMKVYRQVKMYNDKNLNPALYSDSPVKKI